MVRVWNRRSDSCECFFFQAEDGIRDVIHQRQIFPHLVENLQNQPADEGRVNSLRLLQKSNRALDSSVSLIERLTYSTLAILLLNSGILLFCVFEFRRTQRRANFPVAPLL